MPSTVTLRVAYNPTTRVALVQESGAAVPPGSINAGIFNHQIPTNPMRGDVQRVLFHGVERVLYFRKPDGSAGFFPDNITTLQNIEVQATPAVPRLLMGEGGEGEDEDPGVPEPGAPEPVVPPPPPEPVEPPAP